MNNNYHDTKQFLSDTKFYEGYSRYNDKLNRYETWDEAVERVMDMHVQYYDSKLSDELLTYINEAKDAYKQKRVLGAQRALQFGGEQLLKHQMKMYNCTSSYADRAEFFGEIFYILLCGAGAGFSVQTHHIAKLPPIANRTKQPKTHVVEDSIEGWATALDVLMSSYFVGGGKYPEYEGRKVYFDINNIRQKGTKISGGFKAPGPEPLRQALDKIEYILQGLVLAKVKQLRSIHVYDIIMHAADAVLSGGVRRSATICLFSKDDDEMANAKIGDWFVTNPQRARSNNSAVIVRNKIDREQFNKLMSTIKQFGEPGFVFVESEEHTTNPCVTGDTVLKVKDHDIVENGVVLAKGIEYEITMKQYVDNFVYNGLNPLVWSKNIETGIESFMIVSNAALTRNNADIIELVLDDGKKIKLTPDHKIFTLNRGWVQAKDLSLDDDIDTTSVINKNNTGVNGDIDGFNTNYEMDF